MIHPTLKLEGPWDLRRKLKIPEMSDLADGEHVEQILNQVSGVRGYAVDLSMANCYSSGYG